MNRKELLTLTVALQAAITAAACSYDRGKAHPLTDRRTQIAHLLRRAGFAASPDQLDEYAALGLSGAVNRLVEYERVEDDADERIQHFSLDLKRLNDLQRWWLLRMVYTRRPLQERMTLFWHGLLTSATSKVGLPNPTPQNPNPPQYMLDQHNFLREHALDTFENILLGISRNPAMMIWLDSQSSVKGKPNENYPRELLELFSLGVTGPDGRPNYTEQDVREVARAFTGRALDQGKYIFRPTNHDTGVKTILGKTGAFNGEDVVRLLAAHPAAASYICRRLFEYFAFPDPTPQDLEPLLSAYTRTGGSIKAVLRALFTAPVFYSPRAYRSRIKSPVEFTVGAFRSLAIATDCFNLPGQTTRMGQALFNPPNVAGWPGGASWLNSTTWLERANFCNSILIARDDAHTIAPPLATIVERERLTTPEAIVEYFGGILLDGQLSARTRQVLLEYLMGTPMVAAPVPAAQTTQAARSALPPAPIRPGFVDQKVRGMVYLLLASPEYQFL